MVEVGTRSQPRPFARLCAALCLLAVLLAPRALPAARAQSERSRHTQEIWLVAAATATDASGAASDATPALKAAVAAQLDAPVALSATLAYQKSESVGGQALAADGSSPPSIGVQLGLLTATNSDGSTASIVAIVATPDLSQTARGVQADDRIAVDLSAAPALAGASEATISYAFMQTLVSDAAASEAGLSDEQLVAKRVKEGKGRLLGTTNANGAPEAALTPPQPLAVGEGPQLSMAVYLGAGRAAQSGPAAQGSFGALDALALDPTQLTAASQGADPGTGAALAQLQQQTQLETGQQATANVVIMLPDPNAPAKPSYPISPDSDVLACHTEIYSCDMTGTGSADSGSFSWSLNFTLNISRGVIFGHGTWKEHVESHPPECMPGPDATGSFDLSGVVVPSFSPSIPGDGTSEGILHLTLEDASGNPNGTVSGVAEVCNPASGPSSIPGYFPEYIFQSIFIAPYDGASVTVHGCIRDAFDPECVSTGGTVTAGLVITIRVADDSR